MKKNRLVKTILAIVLLLGSGFSTLMVNAETHQQSMHVSPPNQRMILIPGESYSDSFIVSNANDSTRALKYELAIGSFSQNGSENSKDDYEVVDHISVSSYNQIMDWIVLDRTSGSIEPNEKDVINYTINVPENAPAGGQYATILIKDVTDRDTEESGNVAIQNTMQFASIIYAEIAGETKQEGVILENKVPFFTSSSPFIASSLVENKGNVHTDAEYTLEIWPLFSDEEIYTNIEKPKTSLVLPETKRYNTQAWEDAPSFGIFRVRQTVKIFGETSVIEKTIIMCPIWFLFVIIFALVLIIFWLIRHFKTHKRQ